MGVSRKTMVLGGTVRKGKIPAVKLPPYNQFSYLSKLAVYQKSSDINELVEIADNRRIYVKRITLST